MTIPEKLLLRANEVAFTSSSIDEFLQIPLAMKRKTPTQTHEFVRGPIPIAWLLTALKVSHAAAFLGVVLWHLVRMRGEPLVLAHKPLARFGFRQKRALRLLRGLAAVQLIALEVSAGKAPRVRLIRGQIVGEC